MPTDLEQRALRHAARCAIAAGAMPWTFRSMVEGVETSTEIYRRAAHVVERRTVALTFAPGHGTRNKDMGPLPSSRGIDPWSVDSQVLATETTTTSVCPTCTGNKKISCSSCAGTSRVACDDCGGRGVVPGQRGLKNCPSCRGQGTRSCRACRNGLVQCSGCEGLGRVKAWLEIRSQRLAQPLAHPMEGAATLHRDLLSVDDFDRAPATYRNALVADSGWVQGPTPDLEPPLRPSLDPATDRVVSSRVQDFGSSIVRIRYRTRLSEGLVALAGQPLGTLPETNWKPLRNRAVLTLASGSTAWVASMVVAGAYEARAPWFVAHGNASSLLAIGALAASLMGLTVAGMMLPRAMRTRRRVGIPAVLMALTWLSMLVAWFSVAPSLDGAEQSIERGDLEEAQLEVEAVVAEQGVSEASSEILRRIDALEAEAEHERRIAEDQRHLARVQHATLVHEAAKIVGEGWHFDEHQRAAVGLLLARASRDLDSAYKVANRDLVELIAQTVTPHDRELARRAMARAALLDAEFLSYKGDFSEAAAVLASWKTASDDAEGRVLHARAVERLTERLATHLRAPLPEGSSLEAEKALLQERVSQARVLMELTTKPAPIDLAAIEKQLASVERKIVKELRRAERERKRADAFERRRARTSTPRPSPPPRPPAIPRPPRDNRVQCCDGTKSPTCTYDRASLRGCCSHHGGVC